MSLWTDLFGSQQKVQQTSLQNQTAKTAQTQDQTQTQAQQSETKGATTQSQTGTSATSQEQNQSTKGTTSQAQKQATNQTQNSTSGTTGATDINEIVSKLDPATLQALKDLVPGLNEAIGGAGNSARVQQLDQISGALKDRGTNSTDLPTLIAQETAAATNAYATGEGAQVEQVQQGIGSRLNTFSELAASHGAADLAAQVGGVVASTTMAYKQQQTADLQTALQAASAAESGSLAEKSAAIGNLMNVVGQISGAVTSTKGTTQQTQQTSVSDVMQGLVDGTTDTSTAAETLSAMTGQTYTADQMQQLSDTLQQLDAISNLSGTATSDTTSTASGQNSGSTTNNPGLISGLFASIGSLFGGSHY